MLTLRPAQFHMISLRATVPRQAEHGCGARPFDGHGWPNVAMPWMARSDASRRTQRPKAVLWHADRPQKKGNNTKVSYNLQTEMRAISAAVSAQNTSFRLQTNLSIVKIKRILRAAADAFSTALAPVGDVQFSLPV